MGVSRGRESDHCPVPGPEGIGDPRLESRPVATRKPLTDELRAAIDASAMSRYAICRAIDLDPAVMSRFMSGQRGLTLKVLDRLAEYLGLELAPRQQRKE